MTTGTILLLILSVAVAAGLSFYQYFFGNKSRSRLSFWLSVLRFISIFGLLLLLINPVVSRTTYQTEKAPLPIVLDNSKSVAELKADNSAREIFDALTKSARLRDKFDIQPYTFDREFAVAENPDFKGSQTNFDVVAGNLKSINKNKVYPTVLITDGNQTQGADYVYSFSESNKIFPIVLGDTTTFLDLKISRLNVNKYAFLKNKFPVEVFLQYSGNKNITAQFSISRGNSTLVKESVNFSPSSRAATLNLLLPADSPGLQIFRASVTSSERERNTFNNHRNFAVEVIDQRTEVAIVSSLNHPDLGVLKRSIESNAQRRVTVLKPSALDNVSDYNVIIVYQPDSNFRSTFERIKAAGVNTWVITGSSTDYELLNRSQDDFSFRMSGQSEDYLASFDTDFNFFAAEDIGFSGMPPLQNAFGTITPKSNAMPLLQANVRNIPTNHPLMAFTENAGKRNAYLFGENIWKWRMHSYVETKSFEKFDQFLDRVIQFLSSDNKRKSLVVSHESFYNSGDEVTITAQYFNKNYEFDERARLTISVVNRETKQTRKYDMLRGGNSFSANLDGLVAGKYSFSVRELTSNAVYNGYFEILDFDIEKQFVNPDVPRLNQLALLTGGKLFLPNQVGPLIDQLMNDESYKPVERSITRRSPIIDWIWLLIIVATALSAEWFIRKYNGML